MYKDIEKLRENKRAYYKAHKAELTAYAKAYYKAHKAELTAYAKAYYKAHQRLVVSIGNRARRK
jgi:phage host-nuclease inhibitor protein Gam